MRVMVVNAGSTSVKLRILEPDNSVSARENLGPPDDDLPDALERFMAGAGELDVIGHRVVHGGPDFTAPVRIDDGVRVRLEELNDLAPLHNPPALRAVDALRSRRPELPEVACFDTAFHAALPAEARAYALPTEWVARWGLRRYGFHGLSCEWAVERAAALLERPVGSLRMVICHLGGGDSVTAVAGGRSLDTTMGFTPTEGLIMATRSGDVDPGLVAWLAARVEPGLLAESLDRRSGLLALTGGRTEDMEELLKGRAEGDTDCAAAISAYLHRLRAKIAAMATATGGTDALVFTGGIGEHAGPIRQETCAGLGWMGVRIDPDANQGLADGLDADISLPGAPVRILVIDAREEIVVARACRFLLAGSRA